MDRVHVLILLYWEGLDIWGSCDHAKYCKEDWSLPFALIVDGTVTIKSTHAFSLIRIGHVFCSEDMMHEIGRKLFMWGLPSKQSQDPRATSTPPVFIGWFTIALSWILMGNLIGIKGFQQFVFQPPSWEFPFVQNLDVRPSDWLKPLRFLQFKNLRNGIEKSYVVSKQGGNIMEHRNQRTDSSRNHHRTTHTKKNKYFNNSPTRVGR